LLFAIDCCIIIIFYPRQSLFSEHTRILHVTTDNDNYISSLADVIMLHLIQVENMYVF